jgi:hypothetical protein
LPQHEASKADFSTSRVPFQGSFPPKKFSKEGHLNSYLFFNQLEMFDNGTNYFIGSVEPVDEHELQSKGSVESAEKLKQNTFFKILKANAVLMIYNLVESTFLNGIEEIYGKLKSNNIDYSQLPEEIQTIWVSNKFCQVIKPNAHYDSFKKRTFEIVNSIMSSTSVELNIKDL